MISRFQTALVFCLGLLLASCGTNNYRQGESLYKAQCANCHMDDGTGLAKLIPPLVNSNFLKENQDLIPCIIRHGLSGDITVNGTVYHQEMPGQKYTEFQINNIINYINSAWGNDYPSVIITQTNDRLEKCLN